MKKTMIRLLAFVLSLCLLGGCLSAFAAQTLLSGTISVHSGVKILVDGKEFVPVDSEGVPVEVFLYKGTTYLPVRGISRLFGVGVDWDQDTKTVHLGSRDGKMLTPAEGTASVDTTPFAFEGRLLNVHSGVNICYNGEDFVPVDSEGKVVDVFLHNGTTYLPVRAISSLMDAAIDWDQSTKSVLITLKAEEKPEEQQKPTETEKPAGVDQEAAAKVAAAAKATAKGFVDGKTLLMEYYAYYLKVNTVLQEQLSAEGELYRLNPTLYEGPYLMTLTAYNAFDKRFGTYMEKAVALKNFAETLTKRADSYAAEGYTAEEVEMLQTNTDYLKQNQKLYSEFISSSSQADILQFVKDSFKATIYAAVAAIS